MNKNYQQLTKNYQKNKIKVFILILFISLSFALTLIQNAIATNYNIANEADLNANFTNATSSDTLTIINNIVLTGNTASINPGGFSIEGNGNTIDGTGTFSIMDFGSNNFTTINDITLTNGNAGDGGAIYVDGADLSGTITNSIFTNNKANGGNGGGAIFVNGFLSGNITSSNFVNNTAQYGGAISVQNALSGTITNSNFTSNTATTGSGGAIYVKNNLSGAITNSNFENNTAQWGGAIYTTAALNGNITNSIFSNNTANQNGGSIYSNGDLSGNITNSNFNNNTATQWGGAIYVKNALSGTIANSNFTNNKVGYNGGAIYAFSALSGTIANSSFINNTATYHGGAIFVQNDLSGTITNSIFNNNTVTTGNSGAIYSNDALSGTIANSIFSNNTATTGAGGAIYVQNALSGTIANSNFTSNNANQEGGAIAVGALSGTITNSIFNNNTANGANFGGGAIFVFNDLSGNIANSNFTSNNANQEGGAIAVGALSGTITNSIFNNNAANGANFGGGAIFVNGFLSGNITSSNFVNNTAQYGGAINVVALSGTITNSIFSNNTANFGGAIYVYGYEASNFTISASAGQETVFHNNMDSSGANSIYFANGGGGGDNATLTLTGSGLVKLLDPMRAEMITPGQALTIIRDNSAGSGGSLLWGGINRLAADNSVNVNLTDGYTEFQKDFSLVANNSKMIVNMGENHELALNTAGRVSSLAAFDFTNSSAGSSFNIATTTNIVAPRSFLVSDGAYLLVDNTIDANTLQPKFLVHNSTIFKADVLANGTQLWLAVNYNPYTPTPNPYNAQTALEQWLIDTTPGTTLSDSNFRALLNDISSTVPEHIMNSGLIVLDAHAKTINSALANAFGKGSSADLSLGVNNFASLGLVNGAQTSTQKATPIAGLHLWTGYIGNFQNVDKNKGYVGYDVNTNGLLLGGTYDIGEKLAVGAFGGYSHSSVDFDGMHANGDTDGSHFGLFGRYIADCGISTTLDTAYSHFSNSYIRTPDGLDASRADYGQDVFSLGLGFNYDYLPVKNLRISPYVNARSTWLKQDSVNENGPLGAHLNSLNANSFTTSLGSTISYDSIFSDKAMLTSSLLLGYMHEFGDVQLNSNANFIAPTLDNAAHIGFVVKSDKQGRDVFQTGLSLDGKFITKNGQNWGLTASYGLEIRDHSTTNSVYAGVHFDF